MPQITINDEQVEAKVGEKLLSTARRNALHIGFVCDGRGLCKTCTCQVLEGAEKLGEPTEIELQAIPESLRQQGYRLGCQTTIKEGGTITVISRAEQLRRKAKNVVQTTEETTPVDNVSKTVGGIGNLATDYVSSLPYIVTNIIPRFQKMPLKLNKLQAVVEDAKRVAQRIFNPESVQEHKEES